jgi:hypothetical protein
VGTKQVVVGVGFGVVGFVGVGFVGFGVVGVVVDALLNKLSLIYERRYQMCRWLFPLAQSGVLLWLMWHG